MINQKEVKRIKNFEGFVRGFILKMDFAVLDLEEKEGLKKVEDKLKKLNR